MSQPLRVLLIGANAREHSLAWKISQSQRVEAIFVIPGNAGTCAVEKTYNITNFSTTNFDTLLLAAQQNRVNLVIPTQEHQLAAGICDFFQRNAIACFGPEKTAAQLEASKLFAKGFMSRHNIPTLEYQKFSDLESFSAFLQKNTHGTLVLKASGLTSGKGVYITKDAEEALQAAKLILVDKRFRPADDPHLIVEKYCDGVEFSVVVLTDGVRMLPFPPIKDYKRRDNNDCGPNTGGMGCCCPTALCSPAMLEVVRTRVLEPTLIGMRAEGNPFRGVLCVDVIMKEHQPLVLDFDARFGDAEAQTQLPLIDDTIDFGEVLLAGARGALTHTNWRMKCGYSVSTVAVDGFYPAKSGPELYLTIEWPLEDVLLFQSKTSYHLGRLLAPGGRIFTIQAFADSPTNAAKKVYSALRRIAFPGIHYRTDVGNTSRDE